MCAIQGTLWHELRVYKWQKETKWDIFSMIQFTFASYSNDCESQKCWLVVYSQFATLLPLAISKDHWTCHNYTGELKLSWCLLMVSKFPVGIPEGLVYMALITRAVWLLGDNALSQPRNLLMLPPPPHLKCLERSQPVFAFACGNIATKFYLSYSVQFQLISLQLKTVFLPWQCTSTALLIQQGVDGRLVRQVQ